jgi:hypothetical protein
LGKANLAGWSAGRIDHLVTKIVHLDDALRANGQLYYRRDEIGAGFILLVETRQEKRCKE